MVRNILQALDRLPPRARLLLSGCFRDCAFQGPTGPPRFTRLMMQLRLHSAQRLRANAVQDARNAVRAVSLLHDAVYHVPSDADQKEGVYASPNVLVQTLGLSSSSFYLEEVCDLYMATSDGMIAIVIVLYFVDHFSHLNSISLDVLLCRSQARIQAVAIGPR